VIFQAPVLLGPNALPAFSDVGSELLDRPLEIIERRSVGDDLMTVYSVSHH
jgi:riboflavin biosynthesis pyrimidine reductase